MNLQLIELLLKSALGQQSPAAPQGTPTGQHIVVLDRGFVYVGNITLDDEWVHILDAKNIRVWGTKNGLGELQNGPLPDTKLDDCGKVLAPRRALISLMPCKGF